MPTLRSSLQFRQEAFVVISTTQSNSSSSSRKSDRWARRFGGTTLQGRAIRQGLDAMHTGRGMSLDESRARTSEALAQLSQ